MKFINQTSHLGMLAGLALASSASFEASATPKIANINGTDTSGSPIAVFSDTQLTSGSVVYLDRTHTYKGIPTILEGADYVMTRNTDKNGAAYSVSFDLMVDGVLYLMIDNRIGDNMGGTDPASGTDSAPVLGSGVMDWVLALGFTDTGFDIGIDEGNDGSINNTSSVFMRAASAGSYTFGVQNDLTTGGPGGRNMYTFACAPIPEPGTVALASLAAVGLLFLRRR